MKKTILIHLLLFVPIFSFSQEIDQKVKTIRGFIFEEPCIPAHAEVNIKGTDVKAYTDSDGKFTISAKVGDILVDSSFGERTFEIGVTESNCYKGQFFRDDGLYYYPKKVHRERKKKCRKAMRKYKQGFYDCKD